jgi:hypothetical protein
MDALGSANTKSRSSAPHCERDKKTDNALEKKKTAKAKKKRKKEREGKGTRD